MRARLFFFAAALLAASGSAEARYACAVKPTRDGFVALRAGPSTQRPIIARMKVHEMVGLLHPDKEEIVRSGDWLFVRWYPGTRRTADSTPDMDEKKARAGWVRDSLIDCFE
jgi:hypothetical protein